MSQTYYAILTAIGEAKLANAAALNTTLKIAKMAVGDGGGAVPTPTRSQTALVGEWYRAGLNTLSVDPSNSSQIIAELVIPEATGGNWIREMGLYDSDGNLIAVANTPPSYKPQLAEGSGRTQVLRMILIVSSTTAVELKIDPSVILATRQYVDDAITVAVNRLDNKQSVRVATTGSITLSGTQTLDGVAVAAGDRVLVKDQETGAANGIYIAATGNWARAADADVSTEVTPGLLVAVEEGSANANTLWQLITDAPIALGSTPLQFAPFYNNAQINNLLALKANVKSPAFTDKPTAPTADTGTSTDQLATTAFVLQQLAAFGLAGPAIAGDKMDLNSAPLGSFVKTEGLESEAGTYNRPVTGMAGSTAVAFEVVTYGTTSRTVQQATHIFGTAGQARIWVRVRHDSTWSAWIELARLASPAFTGTPTAPTAGTGNNSSQVATTAFVQAALATLVGSAPSTLDTLNELAAALGNDSNFATTMTNALAGKVSLAGGQMTGALRGKIGAPNAGNTNSAGFVFDIDTGLFSPSDGVVQLVSDGVVILQGANGTALQSARSIRAPKGAPAAVDQSYLTGYTFADDGDTGMFAEGGNSNAGSDLVFRIDGGEAGRLKYTMMGGAENGWTRLINGKILQWAELTLTSSAGQVASWSATLPTTFPNRCLQKYAVLGSGCTPQKVCLTAEGSSRAVVNGYLYSEIDSTRVIRVFAIGD